MSEQPMLHGRARNAAIKTAVELCTKRFPLGTIRVKLGKGTAKRWANIETPERLLESEIEAITKLLLEHRLIGTYPDDMGGELWPCVQFDAPRGL